MIIAHRPAPADGLRAFGPWNAALDPKHTMDFNPRVDKLSDCESPTLLTKWTGLWLAYGPSARKSTSLVMQTFHRPENDYLKGKVNEPSAPNFAESVQQFI